MVSNSIRWHIQLWHGTLLVLLVAGMLTTFYFYERNERLSRIDAQLQSLLTPLMPMIGHPGPPGQHGPPGQDRPPEDRGPDFDNNRPPPSEQERGLDRNHDVNQQFERNTSYYYVGWRHGQIAAKSSNAPAIPVPEETDFNPDHPIRTRGQFREILQRTPGETYVVVGTSTAALAGQMHQLALGLIVIGLAIIGAGLAGGWWLAGRALRPIANISATAESIFDGNIGKRIQVEDAQSELGQLATVLNRTFDKLDHAFQQQIRFTADASHELRTPLSVIITQIQLALSRERTPEEYRTTLDTCERAAERMRVLVNSLMELARLDAGELTVARERCDLSRIAQEALDLIQPLARKRSITLQHSFEPLAVQADAMKLGQVLINLMNNAIQHNKEGIELRLSIERNGRSAIIKVSDNGVGIPKESLPHLFDRFYRVDKARTRGQGNSGLGLAISKAIVESHGGAIHVESETGKGATFTIELPLEAEGAKWFSKKI